MIHSVNRNLFAIAILLFTLQGCDDFVEVDRPISQMTTGVVFEDLTTASAALTDIYGQMREYGILTGYQDGCSVRLGLYTDEMTSYETGVNDATSFYNNTLLPSNNSVSSIWDVSYNQIYAANGVIEGVESSVSLSTDIKSQLRGEGLFIRAILHFYLLNLFGDIPYVDTTNFEENRSVSRENSDVVYGKIIQDLLSAESLLETDYVTNERIRPNKRAVQALLARVYLYQGDYPNAESMASEVINDTGNYVWEENLDEVFLRESGSTIWQLSPSVSGANTYEGISYIFPSVPPSNRALSESFVAEFEAGDQRREEWINGVSDGTYTWYHPYKYKQDNVTVTSMEYSIILRLAEQYLIRAEARVIQGNFNGANEDVNKIRHRAGLGEIDYSSESALLEAIQAERRSEFFTELGHRFFDLKRYGTIDQVLGVKPGWDTTDELWPLPQSEMLANPNLKPQNPGY